MRSSNFNLAHGTQGNPQITLEQYEHATMVAKNEAALKKYADSLPLVDPSLIDEMKQLGVKFNEEEVILTTRDATGQVIWLETGNSGAGFTHIQKRGHVDQLAKKFGVETSEVPKLIRNVIRDGKIISNETDLRNGHEVCKRVYEYNGTKLMLVALGTNGFIVSAYPKN